MACYTTFRVNMMQMCMRDGMCKFFCTYFSDVLSCLGKTLYC